MIIKIEIPCITGDFGLLINNRSNAENSRKKIFSKNRKKVLTNAFLFVIISNVAGNAARKFNAGVAQWQSS